MRIDGKSKRAQPEKMETLHLSVNGCAQCIKGRRTARARTLLKGRRVFIRMKRHPFPQRQKDRVCDFTLMLQISLNGTNFVLGLSPATNQYRWGVNPPAVQLCTRTKSCYKLVPLPGCGGHAGAHRALAGVQVGWQSGVCASAGTDRGVGRIQDYASFNYYALSG